MSLAGRLEDLALSDIFQILSVGKKTGALIIKGSGGSAVIMFKGGLVIKAESSIAASSVGEELLDEGHIRKSTLRLAEGVKESLPKKSIADILYEMGAVRKEVLDRVARKRIMKLVYKLLLWQDGDFQFELDDLEVNGKVDIRDYGWEVSKGMSPEYLLMEGARVHDELTQGVSIGDEDMEESGEGGWESDWAGAEVERKDISSLKALTQELRFPNSTSEVTLLILRFASEILQRGVLFIVGDSELAGLGQFGLDIEDADRKIRQTALPYRESKFLSEIIREGRSYKGAVVRDGVTVRLAEELGGGWPEEAVFFPLIADGRVVALLYCDNLPADEEIGQTEGLEIFVSQAGLAFEKALLQRRLQEFEDRGR